MSKIDNRAAPINAPTIPTGRVSYPLGSKPLDHPALRGATESRVTTLTGEQVRPALNPERR